MRIVRRGLVDQHCQLIQVCATAMAHVFHPKPVCVQAQKSLELSANHGLVLESLEQTLPRCVLREGHVWRQTHVTASLVIPGRRAMQSRVLEFCRPTHLSVEAMERAHSQTCVRVRLDMWIKTAVDICALDTTTLLQAHAADMELALRQALVRVNQITLARPVKHYYATLIVDHMGHA